MTIETNFGKITATKDTLRILAHYMDRGCEYEKRVIR